MAEVVTGCGWVKVRVWLEEVRESKRSTEAKGLTLKDYLKFGKLAKKLNDLLSKSFIIDAITNEFVSYSAVRNDTVG